MFPFLLSHFSVSKTHSGALISTLSTGWWLIHLMQRTFNIWVPPLIQCKIIACQHQLIGARKLPCYESFVKGLVWGFWPPTADNISPKGNAGCHSNSIWYNGEYVVFHIGEMSVHWVCFLLLAPPGGDVSDPRGTANLHWVGVVILEIWINLPPVLWCFRWCIQIEPGDSEYTCGAFASSGCHSSHVVSC